MKIKHLIRKAYEIASPYMGVTSIERKLLTNSFVVVLNQDEFLGILTSADIVESPHQLVIDCLHDRPRVDKEDDIELVLKLMKESRNRVLPVFEENQFVGIATQTDITNCLFEYRKDLEQGIDERTAELSRINTQLQLEIKERKKAEDALRKSEKRFRDLVVNSLVGICIVQDGRIVYMNPEQERFFGSLPKSLEFKDLNVHPDDSKKLIKYYELILSYNPPTTDMEIKFLPFDKTGKQKDVTWANCRASLIEYQGGKAILINMVDITRSKELEKLIRVREKMASLGHVAAGIAHEIRNPLSGINVLLDGVRENFEDPESAEDIKEIISQAQKAANKIESVIKRVLDFSRPSEPQLRLADINIPIKEAVRLSQTTLHKCLR